MSDDDTFIMSSPVQTLEMIRYLIDQNEMQSAREWVAAAREMWPSRTAIWDQFRWNVEA